MASLWSGVVIVDLVVGWAGWDSDLQGFGAQIGLTNWVYSSHQSDGIKDSECPRGNADVSLDPSHDMHRHAELYTS